MERTTRAQQRAAAIDVSPAKLAAEIERLARERDAARREADSLRAELDARGPGGGPGGPGGPAGAAGSAGAAEGSDPVKERDEFLAALQRERAEFQNFRRRTAEEREAMLGLAADSLIRKVLALADDFDLAIEHRPESGIDEAWLEGIAAIDRKLRQLLESEGVTTIDAAAGKPFDPREHEAIANVPGTGREEGEIVEEVRRGYRLRDRVIRPALVAVAANTTDETAEADSASRPPHIN
jgi:molecular chaperone GrpE